MNARKILNLKSKKLHEKRRLENILQNLTSGTSTLISEIISAGFSAYQFTIILFFPNIESHSTSWKKAFRNMI